MSELKIPSNASEVIVAYGLRLNDIIPAGHADRLHELMPKAADSAADGKDEARRWIAADAAVRKFLPRALSCAAWATNQVLLNTYEDTLMSLPEVTRETAQRVIWVCLQVQGVATAAAEAAPAALVIARASSATADISAATRAGAAALHAAHAAHAAIYAADVAHHPAYAADAAAFAVGHASDASSYDRDPAVSALAVWTRAVTTFDLMIAA